MIDANLRQLLITLTETNTDINFETIIDTLISNIGNYNIALHFVNHHPELAKAIYNEQRFLKLNKECVNEYREYYLNNTSDSDKKNPLINIPDENTYIFKDLTTTFVNLSEIENPNKKNWKKIIKQYTDNARAKYESITKHIDNIKAAYSELKNKKFKSLKGSISLMEFKCINNLDENDFVVIANTIFKDNIKSIQESLIPTYTGCNYEKYIYDYLKQTFNITIES